MMINKPQDAPFNAEHFVLIDDIVLQAQQEGVLSIINIGTSVGESQNSIALAKRYTSVYAVIGLHPCDCTDDWENDFKKIVHLLEHKQENKIVGIGETGLDFYHKPFDALRQEKAFRTHIVCALEHNLPVIFHVRDAADDILRILRDYRHEKLTGVFHCFLQSPAFAEQILEWGFYVGFDAPVTYPKNTELRELIKTIPLDRIVLETDAPFLPPQILRGKPNRPSYIPLFAPVIADCKEISVQVLAQQTTSNTQRLFKL